jgi:peptide/nickel transport system permease protein
MMTLPYPGTYPPADREYRHTSRYVWPAAFTLLVFGVVIALLTLPGDPNAIDLSARLTPPVGFGGTWDHPLGTDQLGRDLAARLVVGASASPLIAIAATILAAAVGITLGLLGGYRDGRIDRVILWLGDVQLALPFIVIAIGVSAVLDPSLTGVILILAITGWTTYARVARLTARPLRNAPFIDAARVNGASEIRILFRHLLPVAITPLIAIACQQAGAMILYASALSYLGLGIPSDTITWGGMIADARDTAATAWWVTIVPGLAIVLTVVLFTVFGAWLNRRMVGKRSF